MPPSADKRGAPPAAGGDGIDVLPDEVLQHILGFLEAQESVRTCVLARRWRNLWKSAMVLRILAGEGKFLGSVGKLCNFVDNLLRLRGGSPLDKCELVFTNFARDMSGCSDEDEDRDRLMRLVNTWFWHSVSCQVKVLVLSAYPDCQYEPSLVLDNRHVNSQHLTRLQLEGVVMGSRFLNFSNCPALDYLEFGGCYFDSDDSRPHICAPSVVSLHLLEIWGMIPMLESMPSLLNAFVIAGQESWDTCDLENCNCEFCEHSYGIGDCNGSNDSVLLKCLSEAKCLALWSGIEMFIFKRDLRWCPIFSKLKTLFLNDYWCVPDDYRALVCLLQHSPILEELSIAFCYERHRHERERKGILKPMEGSTAISEHLKIIEVKCHAVDERIFKITLFLCAFNIRLVFY
ncbi:unnamed protein product [Urochloa decumbens]|uniref:F-box domain-containing protein n=1 Tax=Urochloa decumbens TaxID=240449 RepID=A0ABC9H0W6_9POAL